ncbi:hypothetical protein B0H14DRAFT_3885640 [Mycena olivaceomarginata]|nr:hypothetical protein B0H14DRAFT_3885640 [Mycena olivaceomarginata]
MPRISKSKKASRNNALKASQARKAAVEKVPEPETAAPAHSSSAGPHLHNISPHPSASDATDAPHLDEEILAAPEISQDYAELEPFSALLRDAQAAAQIAEQARERGRNRPRQYLKNAPRTKRRHSEQAKDLKKKGYLSVFDWIKEMKEKKAASSGDELRDGRDDSDIVSAPNPDIPEDETLEPSAHNIPRT